VLAAKRLADGIDRFTDIVGRFTSWLALVLALVMGANVLLRYGFSVGFIWAQELEWHIMVPICLVAPGRCDHGRSLHPVCDHHHPALHSLFHAVLEHQ
jgi:hypothetical protein